MGEVNRKALQRAEQRLAKSPSFFLKFSDWERYKETVVEVLAVVEEELEN